MGSALVFQLGMSFEITIKLRWPILLVIGRSGGMVWEITVREVSYPGEAQLSLDMTLSARLFPIPYRR